MRTQVVSVVARTRVGADGSAHSLTQWARKNSVSSRLPLGAVLPLLVFLSCCAWPMYRTGSSRSGWAPFDTSTNLGVLQWSFPYDSAGTVANIPGPLVGYTADQALGGIFVGDFFGVVYSVDTTGTPRWTFGAIPVSPNAVGLDGSVYAISNPDNFILYAISRDGTTLEWQFTPPSNGPFLGNLALAKDGTIYAPDDCGVLYALFPTTGKIKWEFNFFESDCPTKRAAVLSPAIGQDGTVYGSVSPVSGPPMLFALTASTGSKIWFSPYAGTPAVAPNGNIYVSTVQTVTALNSKGTFQWQISSPTNAGFSLPAIAPDNSFYVDTATGLWRVDSTGTPIWKSSFCPSTFPPTIGGDGTVFVISGSTLCAVNPVGPAFKWSTSVCNGQFKSIDFNQAEPVIGIDGTIYVALNNGGVDENGSALPSCPLQAFH